MTQNQKQIKILEAELIKWILLEKQWNNTANQTEICLW